MLVCGCETTCCGICKLVDDWAETRRQNGDQLDEKGWELRCTRKNQSEWRRIASRPDTKRFTRCALTAEERRNTPQGRRKEVAQQKRTDLIHDRNRADGEMSLFFWQMTGRKWSGVDSKSIDERDTDEWKIRAGNLYAKGPDGTGKRKSSVQRKQSTWRKRPRLKRWRRRRTDGGGCILAKAPEAAEI